MDSDPVAPVSAAASDKKTPSPWFQFVARIETLTKISNSEAICLANELQVRHGSTALTDYQISRESHKWTWKEYTRPTWRRAEKGKMIEDLAEKIKHAIQLRKEVEDAVENVAPFDKFSLTKEAADLQAYCNNDVPKLFAEATAELFNQARPFPLPHAFVEGAAYTNALSIPDTIVTRLNKIQEMIAFQKAELIAISEAVAAAAKAAAKASKEEEKAAAKAAKEAEKAAAKAAKEAEREAAKAAKEAEKAAAKIAKEAEKATKASNKKGTDIAPSGGAGTAETGATVSPSTPISTSSSDEGRRKSIPKHIKTLVWNKHIGAATPTAKCLSCREELISIRSFHCGHVIAEAKGGDSTINNLRPICAPCNSSMGTMSMNEFTKTYFGWEV